MLSDVCKCEGRGAPDFLPGWPLRMQILRLRMAGIRAKHRSGRQIARGAAITKGSYSGFDSALYRNLDAKWHFPIRDPRRQVLVCGAEENATLLDLQMSTRESNPL